jgi:UDP-N-acetylmuramoylalanine--D-glutamate ligase
MKGILTDWESMRVKPVAVLGHGRSGQGVEKLLNRLNWNCRVYDQQGMPFSLSKVMDCSLVVSSPGFPPNHPWITMAKNSHVPVLGEMDFASAFLPTTPIAVTGTNGKTTLSYLIKHVWEKQGERINLAGNMGIPLSQYLADSINPKEKIVLEVSSFQSGGLKVLEPFTSFWTNFEDDHLDYHETRKNYFLAKLHLMERTIGPCWAGESVAFTARKMGVDLPVDLRIVERRRSRNFPLPPEHFLSSYPQRENYSLAEAYFKTQGISQDSFARAAKDFIPQPYRLKQVAQIKHARFWNDSKATNFSATLAACKSMRGKTIWIGGGKSKGGKVEVFARGMKSYLEHAFVIGEVSQELATSFKLNGIPVDRCDSLPEAVEGAYRVSRDCANVLFSPGFSSFDQFHDFEDRGNLFNQVVFDLKKKSLTSTQVESN